MKKLMCLFFLLCLCSVAGAATYTGSLPPGSDCTNGLCKSCSFDYNMFVAPPCVGGWTAGVYNTAQTIMYIYASNCPWCNTSYCYPQGIETCCGIRIGGNGLPPIWGLTLDTCDDVGCSACDPHSGDGYGCNGGEPGQVYCKVGGQCQYQENPCGENMQWNYKTCLCDCNYTDNSKFRFSKQVGDTKSCYEGDPLNFDDSSWLWAEIYTNPVPGYFKRDVQTGKTLYRVDYSIDWYLDNPCDYDCCPSGWVLSYSPVPSTIVPDLDFKYRVYDWTDDDGGHLINTVSSVPVYQKMQDNIKDDGSIYGVPSLVTLCNEFQTWQGPCPFDMYLGIVVHYYDRTQWPDCNYNSNTFQIKEVKGDDLKGSGGSLQAGGMKSGIKIKGFGGVEFHDN